MQDEYDPIFLVEGFAQAQTQAAGKICQRLRLVLEHTAQKEQTGWGYQVRQTCGKHVCQDWREDVSDDPRGLIEPVLAAENISMRPDFENDLVSHTI